MADGEAVEVRVARLEEWRKSVDDETAQSRAARADLHDSMEVFGVTIGKVDTRLGHLEAALTQAQKSIGEVQTVVLKQVEGIKQSLSRQIDAINETLSWAVKLIVGAIILAVIALLIGTGTGHVRVQ